jgi:predicted TIM-barrel fold metal-dependent hydrolase
MTARAAPRGWHIQFYTPGTIVRDLLPFLAGLEDPFVIDHMGYMLEADRLAAADFDRLLGVLAQGCCWIKLSGPYRIAKSRPLSYVAPVGRALVSTRPDRLIWGSDWPHLPDGSSLSDDQQFRAELERQRPECRLEWSEVTKAWGVVVNLSATATHYVVGPTLADLVIKLGLEGSEAG